MSFAEIFDRLFWSVIIFIFVGLLWLKFLDPVVGVWPGVPVAVLVGGIYFYVWWHKAKREAQKGQSTEERGV